MKADPFSPDMLDFLKVLEHHRVRYLLIGGYAVMFHGHLRFTADIDFGYSPDPENAERLFAALLEFWSGTIPMVDSVTELLQPGMVFQFGQKPNRIDLLSRVAGIDFDAAWERRILEKIEGINTTISIISLQDLRLSKEAAGRPKDLDDLINLPKC